MSTQITIDNIVSYFPVRLIRQLIVQPWYDAYE